MNVRIIVRNRGANRGVRHLDVSDLVLVNLFHIFLFVVVLSCCRLFFISVTLSVSHVPLPIEGILCEFLHVKKHLTEFDFYKCDRFHKEKEKEMIE